MLHVKIIETNEISESVIEEMVQMAASIGRAGSRIVKIWHEPTENSRIYYYGVEGGFYAPKPRSLS